MKSNIFSNMSLLLSVALMAVQQVHSIHMVYMSCTLIWLNGLQCQPLMRYSVKARWNGQLAGLI